MGKIGNIIVIVCGVIGVVGRGCNAFSVPSMTESSCGVGRREAFVAIAGGCAAVLVGGQPQVAEALEACPKDSQNCVRTVWTPPSGTSKDSAVSTLLTVLKEYPQEGQNKVDGGGWSIAEEDLTATPGTARIEYKSAGTGFFAKAFNGGKPFVDDLKLEVDSAGVVQVKSQSRIGESDLGVNQKRVDYLAAALKGKGWSV